MSHRDQERKSHRCRTYVLRVGQISRFGIVTVDVTNGLMIFYLVLLFFIVLTIAQLFTFHLNLIYRGQTTYEFVTGVAVNRSKTRRFRKPRGAARVVRHSSFLAPSFSVEARPSLAFLTTRTLPMASCMLDRS